MPELLEISTYHCLVVRDDHARIRTPQDALDLIGEALGEGATVIAVPATVLDERFFQLRSGLAGEILQKAVNYRIKFCGHR